MRTGLNIGKVEPISGLTNGGMLASLKTQMICIGISTDAQDSLRHAFAASPSGVSPDWILVTHS